jgi:tRNA A37 threonylcarbamoyladenosine biosynthesis protein TsaE
MNNPRKIFESRVDEITYTLDQKKALLLLDRFLISPDMFFLLSGNAGTGKTTLAENIATYCNADVLAPTNAALKRLKNKFMSDTIDSSRFSTLHSILYGAPNPYTGVFEKTKTLKKNKIYVVDEASMIDAKLFEDLIKDAIREKARLVFIGDDFQLEPVGKDPMIFTWEKISNLFNPNWKIKLNEVVRNEGNILDVATHLRNNQGVQILNIEADDFKIKKIFSTDLVTDIQDNNDFVVIVSTNLTRMRYNNQIRRVKFEEDSGEVIADGEKLISVSNQQFLNGEFYTITHPRILQSWEERINTGYMNKPIYSTYKMYFISHGIEGMMGTFTTLLLPQLDKPSIHPSMLMSNSTLGDSKLLTKGNSLGLKKKWLNTVNIATYGYATSAHKSQGSEWDNVYIDCDWLSDSWNKARWMYTAITRAKKKIELKNSNQFQIINK